METMIMEMRSERNSDKRRRKLVAKPVLVRSVKPGQTSALVWERENNSISGIWKN